MIKLKTAKFIYKSDFLTESYSCIDLREIRINISRLLEFVAQYYLDVSNYSFLYIAEYLYKPLRSFNIFFTKLKPQHINMFGLHSNVYIVVDYVYIDFMNHLPLR